MADKRFRLFVYGTYLRGQPNHELLTDAKSLGPAKTQPKYTLVELNTLAGLLEGGNTEVFGELYELSYETLSRCDKHSDHPARFHRGTVELADGSEAEAYLVFADQARARRRLRHGDWRRRFAPARERPKSAWARRGR
ncbi:MAG: gamma-glutamylcyclotransferase [Myxococcales bacterium]|nr:gamma-glutamylcyclotransferase [Myxococcales bacterium]MCB9583160.1 gamma-glutamylcyclotransferase [Polyangiaceae bacterium]